MGKFSSFCVAKNVLLLYLCIAFPPFFQESILERCRRHLKRIKTQKKIEYDTDSSKA